MADRSRLMSCPRRSPPLTAHRGDKLATENKEQLSRPQRLIGPTSFATGTPANSPSLGLVTLPNAITFTRLSSVPLAVWLLLRHNLAAAFAVFLAAGVSDAVDGWLARHGRASAIGAVLDPAADKVLLVSMYVTLAAVRVLPAWIAILVVFRDLVIVGGVLLLSMAGHPVAIRTLFISKVNTALQIILIAASLLFAALGLPLLPLLSPLIWLVAAITLLSGAAYVVRTAWLR